MKKRSLGKKGLSKGGVIWLIIIIGLVAGAIIWHNNCTISKEEAKVENVSLFSNFNIWFQQKILLCEKEPSGVIDTTVSYFKNLLGFNETLYEFFYPGLLTGALVGLWIYLAFILAKGAILLSLTSKIFRFFSSFRNIGEASSLKSSWLGFLASSPVKIIAIAIAYALIMQIPIVHGFIELITFKALGVNLIVRSILLAFYIGLLPSAIEEYTKYRIRKKYYEGLIRAKYRIKADDALLGK